MSIAPEPLYTITLSRRSILDTLFVSQTLRRPAYATTTDGSLTTLWRIDPSANLSEVAQIQWGDTSSSSTQSRTVIIDGQVMLVDNVLQRSKSFFGSDSRVFVAGSTRCKWKSGRWGTQSPSTSSAIQATVAGSIYASSQVWTCHETTAPSGRPHETRSSSSAGSPPILASFVPPQPGFIKSELVLYQHGEPFIDHIVLTAILLCARKDEWRSAQSIVTRDALEASLKAEIRGALPPYIPTASARSRVTSPRQLRRTQSAHPTRSRHASSAQPPPPYTNTDAGVYPR